MLGYAETASKCEETAEQADIIWLECGGPLRLCARQPSWTTKAFLHVLEQMGVDTVLHILFRNAALDTVAPRVYLYILCRELRWIRPSCRPADRS